MDQGDAGIRLFHKRVLWHSAKAQLMGKAANQGKLRLASTTPSANPSGKNDKRVRQETPSRKPQS
jgi:hypothetical protein